MKIGPPGSSQTTSELVYSADVEGKAFKLSSYDVLKRIRILSNEVLE